LRRLVTVRPGDRSADPIFETSVFDEIWELGHPAEKV
jgi:hypothetical protein